MRSEVVEPQGRFKITAPVDVGNTILPCLTAHFLEKYPKVELDILLTDRRVDFLDEQVDLAIRAGRLKDSSLIAKKAGEVVFKMYASPQYLKGHGMPRSIKDISQHMCIHFTSLAKEGWQLKKEKRSLTVPLPKKIVVNNIQLAQNLAIEGAGLAFLPSFLSASAVKSGTLKPILEQWTSTVAPLHFLYPAQKYVSPVVRAFIELSSEVLKKQFPFIGPKIGGV
ncbi:MAG: substrate binding domain-containing protein [Bdellovibrionota bacterium]